jgi:hypothetical protein
MKRLRPQADPTYGIYVQDPAVWGTLASADLCAPGTGRGAPDRTLCARHEAPATHH